ncbi:hypothetical protein N9V65_01860 [Flavobacteriales bacterium]|nr:hypothetical protein [Flavobacteriales bacterium]
MQIEEALSARQQWTGCVLTWRPDRPDLPPREFRNDLTILGCREYEF